MKGFRMDSIVDILRARGVDISENASLDDIAKAVRAAKRDATQERISLLEQKKDENRSTVISLAQNIRDTLESEGAGLLPGSHLNFTVRVGEGGTVTATANECHATGFVESIHVTAQGEVVTGKDGAEAAKNVRARKKS